MGFDLGNLAGNLIGSVAKNNPAVALLDTVTGGFLGNTIDKTIGTIGDQLSGNRQKTGDGFEKTSDVLEAVTSELATTGKVNAGNLAKTAINNSGANDATKAGLNLVADMLQNAHETQKAKKQETAAADETAQEPAKKVTITVVDENGKETTQTIDNQVTAAQIDENGHEILHYADGSTVDNGPATIVNSGELNAAPSADEHSETAAAGNTAEPAEIDTQQTGKDTLTETADKAESPKPEQAEAAQVETEEKTVYEKYNEQWENFTQQAKKEAEEQGLTGSDVGIYAQRKREAAFQSGELKTLAEMTQESQTEKKV